MLRGRRAPAAGSGGASGERPATFGAVDHGSDGADAGGPAEGERRGGRCRRPGLLMCCGDRSNDQRWSHPFSTTEMSVSNDI